MAKTLDPEINQALLPEAFWAGLRDSINPYSFATILIFIVILSLIGFSVRRVFVFGAVFILSSAGIHLTTLTGTWDSLVTHERTLNAIQMAYFVLAIFFLLIGVNDFVDWRRIKANGDSDTLRMPPPAMFQDRLDAGKRNWKRKTLEWVFLLIIVALFGAGATLMASIGPQDEYMFILHSYLLSREESDFVNQSFLLYSLAMVLFLIIAWVKIGWLTLKKKKSTRALMYYKMVLSAFFISTGLGLSYYFIK